MGLNAARILPCGVMCCRSCERRQPEVETFRAVFGTGEVQVIG
jgi:hypothetical protein